MRTTLKIVFITALTLMLLLTSALPCLAEDEDGRITVTLEDKEKNHINDIKVSICQIAELNNSGYFLATAFEASGISISGIMNDSGKTTAKTIFDYVKKNNVEAVSKVSENGKASFLDLNLGIWLVYCEEDSSYTFNPYIVFLPFESGGELCYELTSAPKLENNTPNEINIYVIKKWDDKNNSAKVRPQEVTVELLNGDDVVSSAVLSEENGWAHTFSAIPKDGDYSVREKEVANYKADYSGEEENGFVVTNTYTGEKLPQTGQYWWPIILIAIAGACFVLLGVYEIGVKKNGKKK